MIPEYEKIMSFKIQESLYEQIKAHTATTGSSMSDFIRGALQKRIQEVTADSDAVRKS